MKAGKVGHSEFEDCLGPLAFTCEDAKGKGGIIPEGDDDSLDDMFEVKVSWSVAKQMGFCLEDDNGMLKALAKINRRVGKESKSKKKRKHKRKFAKEVRAILVLLFWWLSLSRFVGMVAVGIVFFCCWA